MLHIDSVLLQTHSLQQMRPAVLTVNFVDPRTYRRSYSKSTTGGVSHFHLYDAEILHQQFSRVAEAWTARCTT